MSLRRKVAVGSVGVALGAFLIAAPAAPSRTAPSHARSQLGREAAVPEAAVPEAAVPEAAVPEAAARGPAAGAPVVDRADPAPEPPKPEPAAAAPISTADLAQAELLELVAQDFEEGRAILRTEAEHGSRLQARAELAPALVELGADPAVVQHALDHLPDTPW